MSKYDITLYIFTGHGFGINVQQAALISDNNL